MCCSTLYHNLAEILVFFLAFEFPLTVFRRCNVSEPCLMKLSVIKSFSSIMLCSKTVEKNKQFCNGKKKFNMDPKKVSEDTHFCISLWAEGFLRHSRLKLSYVFLKYEARSWCLILVLCFFLKLLQVCEPDKGPQQCFSGFTDTLTVSLHALS